MNNHIADISSFWNNLGHKLEEYWGTGAIARFVVEGWRLMLLGIVLGAAVGIFWHIRIADDTRFQATFTVRLEGLPAFQVTPANAEIEENAIRWARATTLTLRSITQSSVAFHDLVIGGNLTEDKLIWNRCDLPKSNCAGRQMPFKTSWKESI